MCDCVKQAIMCSHTLKGHVHSVAPMCILQEGIECVDATCRKDVVNRKATQELKVKVLLQGGP